MDKELIELCEKTEERRLKIKKLRKLNTKKNIYKALTGITSVVGVGALLTTIYTIVERIQGKNVFCDIDALDYLLAAVSFIIAIMSGAVSAELYGDAEYLKVDIKNAENEIKSMR